MLRRLILLLLCLALPLQGMAALRKAACPMAAQMGMAAAIEAEAALPDCCNDAATFAATGQSCKAGQACAATLGLPLPAPRGLTDPAFPDAAPHASLARGAVQDIVANPWRPPAGL